MAKIDPRADPDSELSTKEGDFSVDRVDVGNIGPASPSSVEQAAEASDTGEGPKPVRKITSQDPRYEPLEKLLDKNDWKQICDDLGPMESVGKLPPNLGLVAALASHEMSKDGDQAAVAIAIRCMAGVLGVAEDSPIARVLARRLLRKNPVRFSERKAPPARTSFLIVLLALIVGGGVGLLAAGISLGDLLRLLHLQ